VGVGNPAEETCCHRYNTTINKALPVPQHINCLSLAANCFPSFFKSNPRTPKRSFWFSRYFLLSTSDAKGEYLGGKLMNTFELMSFRSAVELAQAAAIAWLQDLEKSNRTGNRYCVALSGGRIAQDFFSAVVNAGQGRPAAFRGIHFFWADERCVPPSDSESNYRVAAEHLFVPLKLLDSQIHRMRGEAPPPIAAHLASQDLRQFASSVQNGLPVLDMIFLGMGEDGHVASLFPGEPASSFTEQPVYRAVANSPKPPPNRVTLNFPTIYAARKVWMLASGPGKEKALQESLLPNGKTPFADVLHHRSDTRIWTDISVR
jgi:6-phosphogluconolactonase